VNPHAAQSVSNSSRLTYWEVDPAVSTVFKTLDASDVPGAATQY